MAIELEGLEFQIETTAAEAEKGLKKLQSTLSRLGRATQAFKLSRVADQVSNLSNAVDKVNTGNLERLARACTAFKRIGNVQIPRSFADGVRSINDAARSIDPEQITKLQALADAAQRIKSAGGISFPNNGNAVATGANEATHSVEAAAGATNRLKAILDAMPGVFSKAFSFGVRMVGSLGSVAKSTAGRVKELVKQFALLPVHTIRHAATSMKTFSARIKDVLKMAGRMVFMRAIRHLIKGLTEGIGEGIKNLYHWSETVNGTFHKSMNRIATDTQYLKNSLGAMASPLLNALAPVIDMISDKLVELFNLANQFIAKLTGQTVYTAARKVAAVWDDATKKTQKATDAIKRYTLGFDQLNILGSKDNSGSGNTGKETDYSSMFETRKIDSSIADFADKVKQLFVSQDWKGLGTIIGDKFNSVIDSVDWSNVGSKIGSGINGAIQTAYWLLDSINFTNIGSKIASFLNGAIGKIDFSYLGGLLVKRITIIADTIIGFLTTFNWGQAASAYSSFVKGCYDELTRWFSKYDWRVLGVTLWSKVKEAVINIDYAGIASSFFRLLGSAIRTAAQFLGGFFGSIADDIKLWWNKDIQGKDWKETAGNLLSAIGRGFTNIGKWVLDNIVNPFGKALLGEKWESVKAVAVNIWNAVKEGWDKLMALPGHVLQFFTGVVNQAGLWWGNVKTWWRSTTAGKTVDSFVTNVKNTASTWWNDVKKWWKAIIDPTSAQNFIVNVKNSASTWWNDVKTYWSDFMTSWRTLPVVASITNNISALWENVKEWWNNTVGDLWLSLKVKLPHFYVNWGTASTFFGDFNYPKSLGVNWYAKGGILNNPTLFGMLGNNLLGGGEAGKEAVLPLERHTEWMETLATKVRDGMPENDASLYEAVYNAVMDANFREANLMRELLNEMRKFNEKEFTAEISTDSIIRGIDRKNRRLGTPIIPLG